MIKRDWEIKLGGKETRVQPIPKGWTLDIDPFIFESARNVYIYVNEVSPYIGIAGPFDKAYVIVKMAIWSGANGTYNNSWLIISDNDNLDSSGEVIFEVIYSSGGVSAINNDFASAGNYGNSWRSFDLFKTIRRVPFYIKYKASTGYTQAFLQMRKISA